MTSIGMRRLSGVKRVTAIAASLLIAGGALTACGAAGAKVEADSSGNRTIRIAAPFISTMNSAVLYAAGAGIFDKYNIKVKFVEVSNAGGLAATLGGSTDMSITSAVNPLAALEQGQEFPIIAATGNGFPESVIVTKKDWDASGLKEDSPLKDKMAFLRGKKWGVSSPEGSSVYMAKYLFQLAGFKQSDFNMNSLGSSSGTLAALKAEKVVAGSMGSPYPQIAQSEGYAHVFLGISGGEVPEMSNILTSVVAVTPDFLKNNEELVTDFKKALGEAQGLVYSQPEKVDEWVYEHHFEGTPKEAVLAGVADQRAGGSIARQPEVSEEAAQKMVTFMEATGQTVPDDWKKLFVDFPDFQLD
jgi:ABC-type nitrate/sulfonate/bicarbonate transport system substrate-binding protein